MKYLTPEDYAKLFGDMSEEEQESFHVVLLDSQLQIMGRRKLVSLGTSDACLVHPVDIFREAIRKNAKRIVIVHTHPSGNVHPSEQDQDVIHHLRKAAEILLIELVDFLIIAGQDYWSWQEHEDQERHGLLGMTITKENHHEHQ